MFRDKKGEQGNLFDSVQLDAGGNVIDNADITTYILYFSTPEAKEFKKLLKEGIKKMLGKEAMERGNASDFIFELLQLFKDSYLPQEQRDDYIQGWKDHERAIELEKENQTNHG